MTQSHGRGRGRRVVLAATAVLCSAGAAVAAAPSADASGDGGPPTVQVVVSRPALSSAGGVVEMRADVSHAITCWFTVGGLSGYVPRPRSCANGIAVGSVRVGPVGPRTSRRIVVTAFAQRGRAIARSAAVITQSPNGPLVVGGLGKLRLGANAALSGGLEVPDVTRPAPPAAQLVAYPVGLTRFGGKVVTRLVSFRAMACWFAVAGDLRDHTVPVPCSRGFTTGALALPPNRGKFARVVRIIAYAKNTTKTVRSITIVVQPGVVAKLAGKVAGPDLARTGAPVVDIAASSTSLGAGGGGLALHIAAIGAKTCWLKVPGDPSASTPRPCADGFAALDALLGKNTSGVARTLAIVVFASNGSTVSHQELFVHQASVDTGRVGLTGVGPTVVRRAPAPAVTPTVPPVVTPTVPPVEPAPAHTMPSYIPPTYTPPTTSTLAITTTSLPSGTVSSAYSATLVASGGTSPYSWALGSGSTLPAGLSLSSSGAISGTPSAAGTSSVVVVVTDHAGATASATLSLDVVAAASPLAITTTSLPSGTVSSAYSANLAASGGTSPYSWALGSGSTLPAGLSLSSSGALFVSTCDRADRLLPRLS